MSRKDEFQGGEKVKADMVDIGNKPPILRVAKAEGVIKLKPESIRLIKEGKVKKGDAFSNASLAAINAVKKTSDLIFLAHPIPILNVDVDFKIDEEASQVLVSVEVKSIARTGVELEALNGVMIALLSIFDMLKYVEKDEKGQYPNTSIGEIKVIKKQKELI
ncbi:MAG: cyclic pyranopterin monophosphate synthase MoaC [Candidatus Wukongarchaeota archaeon]|nr:cyclic pyranopterin monophosphate synthase MoaC [Candidatus Wukongarchaeota archaeon]